MPAKKQRKKCAEGRKRNPKTNRCKDISKFPKKKTKNSWNHNQKTGAPRRICVVYKTGDDGKRVKGKGSCKMGVSYPGKTQYAKFKRALGKTNFDAKRANEMDQTSLGEMLKKVFVDAGVKMPEYKKVAESVVRAGKNKTSLIIKNPAYAKKDLPLTPSENLIIAKMRQEALAAIQASGLEAQKAKEEAAAAIQAYGVEGAKLRLESDSLAAKMLEVNQASITLVQEAGRLETHRQELEAHRQELEASRQNVIAAEGSVNQKRAEMEYERIRSNFKVGRTEQGQNFINQLFNPTPAQAMNVEENATLVGARPMTADETSMVRQWRLDTPPPTSEIIKELTGKDYTVWKSLSANADIFKRSYVQFGDMIGEIEQGNRGIMSLRDMERLFKFFNDARELLGINVVASLDNETTSSLFPILQGMTIQTFRLLNEQAQNYINMQGAQSEPLGAFKMRIVYNLMEGLFMKNEYKK